MRSAGRPGDAPHNPAAASLLPNDGECRILTDAIGHRIVKHQHGQMKLADEKIFIVSAIPDDATVVRIARQIISHRSFAGTCADSGIASTRNLISRYWWHAGRVTSQARCLQAVEIELSSAEVGGSSGSRWLKKRSFQCKRQVMIYAQHNMLLEHASGILLCVNHRYNDQNFRTRIFQRDDRTGHQQ